MERLKTFLIVVLTLLSFSTLYLCAQQQQMNNRLASETDCDEIQQSYANILYRIWIDNPNYVEDVLMETDEWCELFDVVGHAWMDYTFKSVKDSLTYEANLNNDTSWVRIPDSTYHRMRSVFPDLPAEQAKPDFIKRVEQINL